MQVRLWMGPAGSGKTHRCVEAIRARLRESVEGPPLVLLGPRQMTFQLERQMLAGAVPEGYTRLLVVSFERLCHWLWEELGGANLRWLTAEGRTMVMRSLLGRLKDELRVLRAGMRRPGLAGEVSEAWVTCKRYRVTAARLARVATELEDRRLAEKLRDWARLGEAYEEWLARHGLADVQALAERVVELLEQRVGRGAWIEGVWVDGFAELAPHEVALLAALTRHCREMTVTFCLDRSGWERGGWLTPWRRVERSKERFLSALAGRSDVEIEQEWLEPRLEVGRFDACPGLSAWERAWAWGRPVGGRAGPEGSVRLVSCEDPVAEARFAAREIWRFVRAGGRFREVLVLVRDLEAAHGPLRRVFGEYEIPCHWDRREPVSHHPVVVLTRGALRLVARDWRLADWLSVLKSGLVRGAAAEELDALENEALACGWEGRSVWWGEDARAWWRGRGTGGGERWERLLGPWREWDEVLGSGARSVEGGELVRALRRLWGALRVEEQLEEWAAEAPECGGGAGEVVPGGSVHRTVWEAVQVWLEDVELAFGSERLGWSEWLPVLEAGLAELTVGVIPPALDQVLVGTVDRSRQSEARLVLLLGWNEGVFPARPRGGPLLSEEEWQRVEEAGLAMELSPLEQRAREEHFAYVACTRARERVVISWCRRDGRGRVLNPSPFVARIRLWYPGLPVETVAGEDERVEGGQGGGLVHWRECWPRVLRAFGAGGTAAVEPVPEPFRSLVDSFVGHVRSVRNARLSPVVVKRLHGECLRLSATQLERFAACPFQFFVWGGLLAREREVHEVDAADRGSFLHRVLALFHEEVTKEGRRWRDLSDGEARSVLRRAAAQVVRGYRHGLFGARAVRRCMVERWVRELEAFLEVILGWMREGRYRLDPVLAEWEFGRVSGDGGAAEGPGVTRELDGGRRVVLTGRLDRVDALRLSDEEALAVVMDYKSGRARLERLKVEAGLDWQLRVYLRVVEDLQELRDRLGVRRVRPVGAFYVPLRPGPETGPDPELPAGEAERARRCAYQHMGLFDFSAVGWLEAGDFTRGEQFPWRRRMDGQLQAGCWQAMDSAGFDRLRRMGDRLLAELAERIWSGEAGPDPYRHGSEVACDLCECAAICRLDRRRHRFRLLKAGGGGV